MEKEERVASPLGAPHLGMDFFPVFDSRLDDSPKFRAQLQHWADRSKKFKGCLQDFKEKLVDFHNSGVRHNKAARELVLKMEYLGEVLEEEKGMEEVSAPFAQFTEILGQVWTYHNESNLQQTASFTEELEEVIQNFGQVSDTYDDILLARSTSLASMDRFTSCKQGMKTTDPSGWSNFGEVTCLTQAAYKKVLSQFMVSLRTSHSINMLKFMQRMMDFMLAEFSFYNFSTSLFKNLEAYWDKLFKQVKDEKGTCEADLKAYTQLQRHVQKKATKEYFEQREAVGLSEVNPNLNVVRVTDALQSVLSSYQPLAGQEKKAFLRPLQQLFPGYEDMMKRGSMKKSKSMEWEIVATDNASIASEGDTDSVDTPPVASKLQRFESVEEVLPVTEGKMMLIAEDEDVLEELRQPECPIDDGQLTPRRRVRVFSFGRRYSPLEQKQKTVPPPPSTSTSQPDSNPLTSSTQAPARSGSNPPLKSSSKSNVLKGTKGLLKKAKGSFVNMVTMGRHGNEGDVSSEQSLEELNGYPEAQSESSGDGEGEESQWEEPLEPIPPSWVKYGYAMVGERSSSGKVKWSQRPDRHFVDFAYLKDVFQYCIVDRERGELLYQLENMEQPSVLCSLLLSSAKMCTQEHVDRDCCVRIVLPNTEYYLQALCDTEAREWLKALEVGTAQALDSSAKQPTVPDARTRILAVPGNTVCADCSSTNVEWASINLGTAVCISCSGVHRGMGVHISKVRSLRLDLWDLPTVEFMESMGNLKSNEVYEKRLQELEVEKPQANASKEERGAFIRKKYIDKEFTADVKNLLEQSVTSNV